MKNITAINFKNLRNNEFRSIMEDSVKFAKDIAEEDITASVTAFERTVSEYGEFLETSVEESLARRASVLDAERTAVYSSCKKVAKALTNIPDAGVSETGTQIWRVFESVPDPRGRNQSESTGIILKVVESLKNIDTEKLNTSGFATWLTKLESANSKYTEADRERNSERGRRELEHGKKLREACTEGYRVLVAVITAKAVTGDAHCEDFIDRMNGVISAKKVQLKIRKGRITEGPGETTPIEVVIPTTVEVENVA